MNKVRRKNLQAIIDRLEELKGSLEDLQAEEKNTETTSRRICRKANATKKPTKPVTIFPVLWTVWKKLSAASKLLSSERRKPYDDQNVGIHSRALD